VNYDWVSSSSVLIFSLAMLSVFGTKEGPISEIDERPGIQSGFQDNITASTPISSVRTSPGNIFFPAKTGTSVSALSSFHCYYGFIDNHAICFRTKRRMSLNKKTPP